MSTLTVCYSMHRQETLQLTARVMQLHDVIILEEPFHPDFKEVLTGHKEIPDLLLELDVEFPELMTKQYLILQKLYESGKKIIQIEPYLEHLIRIQLFFADGNKPEDIVPGTVESSVYKAERNATKRLISYYKAVSGNDFPLILSSMNEFAKADAARFVLRDTLRAQQILRSLESGKATYIEAGSIHLFLYKLLRKHLSNKWELLFHSIDRISVKMVNGTGTLFSPGDKLTLHYIWGKTLKPIEWATYCAQALIYMKITTKEEMGGNAFTLPHTRNELESLASVNELSVDSCKELFMRIRSLPTIEAAMAVTHHLYGE